MPYNWQEQADGGTAAGDKIPIGIHFVTGKKTVHGEGPKGPWVMLVVEDDDGREGTVVFTLSDKASWTMARWISRCGEDLKAMEAEGTEPKHFVNPDIAAQYLVGASCWVRVEAGQNPKYLKLTPIKEEEAVAEGAAPPPKGGKPDLNLDDIPF